MGKHRKTYMGEFPNNKDWLLKLAASDPLAKYSKGTRDILRTIHDAVNKGTDEQIAFRDTITAAGLGGPEFEKVEKRTDIAAILWDEYEIEVNPINIDERTPEHTS